MFARLVSEGHAHEDLLWVYPTDLVYRYYELAAEDEARRVSIITSLLRLTGFTARDTDKKGNAEIIKAWDSILKPLSKPVKKRRTRKMSMKGAPTKERIRAEDDKPVVTHPAAAAFMHGSPVKITRPVTTPVKSSAP